MRVVARVRPMNSRERNDGESDDGQEYNMLVDEEHKIVGLRHAFAKGSGMSSKREETHNFAFDRVFGPETPQENIFDLTAKDAVQWIVEGYNSTIFACKSFSLLLFCVFPFFYCDHGEISFILVDQ